MAVCGAPGTGAAFLSRTLSFIDCHARGFGEAGYLALTAPGSVPLILTTTALTLFVAFYGMRLMLGGGISVSGVTLSVAKMGIVLMLAMSWPAVRTLIYDTTMSGPDEIAVMLGVETIGMKGGANARLQQIDDGIVELARIGTGRGDSADSAEQSGTPPAGVSEDPAIADEVGFAVGRYAFLVTVIGASALVKVGAGLLIALTPFFALLFLFGGTYSLFTGWLRGLLASGLGALVVTVMSQAQVGLIEPWLRAVLAARLNSYAAFSAPIELAVMTTAFALATFASLGLIARICFFPTRPVGSQSEFCTILRPIPFKNSPTICRKANPLTLLGKRKNHPEHRRLRTPWRARSAGNICSREWRLFAAVPLKITQMLRELYPRRSQSSETPGGVAVFPH